MMDLSESQGMKTFPHPETGCVEEVITPNRAGRVHYCATSWPARLYPDHLHVILQPNDNVMVLGRIGITLLVKPLQ